MPHAQLILHPDQVNAYLEEHELESSFHTIEAILMHMGGVAGGKSAVMIVATIEGKKHIFKTSLDIFAVAAKAMRTIEPIGP